MFWTRSVFGKGRTQVISRVSVPGITLRIMTYNILAEQYASKKLHSNCPAWALNWAYRKEKIREEIELYCPDVACLQVKLVNDLPCHPGYEWPACVSLGSTKILQYCQMLVMWDFWCFRRSSATLTEAFLVHDDFSAQYLIVNMVPEALFRGKGGMNSDSMRPRNNKRQGSSGSNMFVRLKIQISKGWLFSREKPISESVHTKQVVRKGNWGHCLHDPFSPNTASAHFCFTTTRFC